MVFTIIGLPRFFTTNSAFPEFTPLYGVWSTGGLLAPQFVCSSGNLRNLHPYSHISLGKINFIRTVGLLEYFIIFFASVRSIYIL